MKSAYELAMERFGGDEPPKSYTDEQKEQLADVDRLYDSRAAQTKFNFQARLNEAAGNPQELASVKDQLRDELARLERRREAKKDDLRRTFADGASESTDS